MNEEAALVGRSAFAVEGVRRQLIEEWRTRTGNGWSLGKARLLSRLQALLQSERIKLLRTTEADTLTHELLNYEIKIDQNANDTYGAFKTGTHYDLVTALGLATIEEKLRATGNRFDPKSRRETSTRESRLAYDVFGASGRGLEKLTAAYCRSLVDPCRALRIDSPEHGCNI